MAMIKHMLLFLLVPAAAVLAQPGQGRGLDRMRSEPLNLTAEQQEQINELQTGFQKQAIDLRAEVQKLQLELREEIQADQPNKRAIDATLDKLSAKQAELHKLRVYHQLDVRALLTPEQRKTFDARQPGPGFGMGMECARRPGGRMHRW
jgi:Spy/CpxP family protein refolding chaperone